MDLHRCNGRTCERAFEKDIQTNTFKLYFDLLKSKKPNLAELSNEFRHKIETSNRIAVPGCYASGFNSIVYPLVHNNFISNDY